MEHFFYKLGVTFGQMTVCKKITIVTKRILFVRCASSSSSIVLLFKMFSSFKTKLMD